MPGTPDITETQLKELRTDRDTVETALNRIHQRGYPAALVSAECQAFGVRGPDARRAARNASDNLVAALSHLDRAYALIYTAETTTKNLLDRATETSRS